MVIVKDMAKADVIDRVTADLARGFTQPAIQRLSSLVAAHPTDLDLRQRLAAIHRRVGDRIQAGRWDYLTPGADPADTTAFERAFPSAVVRLRELCWPHRASRAATSYARKRLAALFAAAEVECTAVIAARPNGADAGPAATRRPERRPRRRLRALVTALAVLVTALLVAVGAVTVLQWLVR